MVRVTPAAMAAEPTTAYAPAVTWKPRNESGHQSVAISGHQRSSAVISGHQWSSAVIGGHQRSSVVISGHQRSSAVISGHQRSSAVTWKDDEVRTSSALRASPKARPVAAPMRNVGVKMPTPKGQPAATEVKKNLHTV